MTRDILSMTFDELSQAFSAEDRCVVGDIVISDIKRKM